MEETNNSSNSGVNTMLIVIVLVVLVGLGVWWVMSTRSPAPESTPSNNGDLNIDLTLPTGNNGGDTNNDTSMNSGSESEASVGGEATGTL